ncbi:MAG: putative DNA binding domain-containing protein [Clostridia bacterium]|nr:putative DNA binding domain-containing protein [Clostridia bacterium]
MIEQELKLLIEKIENRRCEEQIIEVKSAHGGCPEKLYDTISSFSNQDEGGTIVFGLDEKQSFKRVGVYDAQDLQKKIMEHCEQMTPVVRPVLTVYDADGMVFVSAEIPPLDISERPCFKTARGRLQGSYVRVGDADKPMTEYEVYSYEAFRKKYRDDIRPVDDVSIESLDKIKLDEYIALRKKNRPHLATIPEKQMHELIGVTRDGKVTLAAVLLFSPYPQAYFPQLGIIATSVPGTQMGVLDEQGQRFTDSKRIEGTIPEMLDGALAFVRSNMRVATRIDKKTGKRTDIPQYPMDAVREAILNALVHRDYSIHTQGMPIQIIMYTDRMEISNHGGLYGRLRIDQLGKTQPDTRNPVLITAMEVLGETENRYSGIPRIRCAMQELGLPEAVFTDQRGVFTVTLYNSEARKTEIEPDLPDISDIPDEKGLIAFCKTPRSRREIIDYLAIASTQYALRRYLAPLVKAQVIAMSNPEHPKDPEQRYYTVQIDKA